MADHLAFAQLDRSGEPWVATLVSVGVARVYADGTWQVDAVDAEAEALLVQAWATTLSHVRRGRRLLSGTTMCGPGGDALLVSGGLAEQAEVCLLLAEQGWSLVADGLAPAELDTSPPLAHPRSGPWLVPGRLGVSSPLLTGERIRESAPSRVVDVVAIADPVALAGHIAVDVVTTPWLDADSPLRRVSGSHRFSPQFAVLHDAGLVGIDDPARVIAHDMAVVGLPLASLAWPPSAAEADEERSRSIEALLDWWAVMTG